MRGAGDGGAVVDLGAQRVQRHATLAVPLATAHLRAAEATRALDPDAQRTALDRRGDRLAHRAAERHATFELLGDALRDQHGVELGALDLDDVDGDAAAGDLLELLAQDVDFGALLADDDARTRGPQLDDGLVALALDVDLAERGAAQTRARGTRAPSGRWRASARSPCRRTSANASSR